MTIYELKRKHLEANPESHFFDRETMRFFGNTLKTMRVIERRPAVDLAGKPHDAYIVRARCRDFDGWIRYTEYCFDAVTFKTFNERRKTNENA